MTALARQAAGTWTERPPLAPQGARLSPGPANPPSTDPPALGGLSFHRKRRKRTLRFAFYMSPKRAVAPGDRGGRVQDQFALPLRALAPGGRGGGALAQTGDPAGEAGGHPPQGARATCPATCRGPRRQCLWPPRPRQVEGWPELFLLHPQTWATREQLRIL